MARRHQDRRGKRAAIAQLSARMLAEGTAADFQSAKRKAAAALGVRNPRELPDSLAVQEALSEYQRIFEGEALDERIRALRTSALAAMQFLEEFAPALVGPVLYGTAVADSPITLHLFHDEPEAVARRLLHARIPFELDERRLRLGPDRHRTFPLFRCHADGCDLELIVFPANPSRDRPLSPLDGKPMRRADIRKLTALLKETPAAGLA